MSPTIADLQAHRIVALAGGTSKTRAVAAILRSGLLHGLITDEATARRLAKAIPGAKPGKKNGKTATGTA
jgi:DNA-binding transcriptional regulator LsrR (DeoR family)